MKALKIRIRAGSWNTFERRFQPRSNADDTVLVDLRDLPKDIDPHRVWTITDEEGRLYVFPGYRFVNRFAYVVCNVPWTEDDQRQPPYRYD